MNLIRHEIPGKKCFPTSESCSVVSDSCHMEFSRPEYWSGYSFPSPGDLPNAGIKPRSPTLQADSLPTELSGKPKNTGVGSLSLLQQIFPTQESNRGLLHCRQILYQLTCWVFKRSLQYVITIPIWRPSFGLWFRAMPLQSCPTLCDPMDCSLPGSSIHGSLQARILEWVAVPSSRGLSRPRD